MVMSTDRAPPLEGTYIFRCDATEEQFIYTGYFVEGRRARFNGQGITARATLRATVNQRWWAALINIHSPSAKASISRPPTKTVIAPI